MMLIPNSGFAQCGPDGIHPCNSNLQKTTTNKTKLKKKSKSTDSKTNITSKKSTPKIDKSELNNEFIESKTGIILNEIPEGDFELTRLGESVQFKLDYKFLMGKYEVTQSQWKSVMGTNPSYFPNCGGNCPVENVSWDEIRVFISKLNILQNDYLFRLPTETEWDWACQCGVDNPLYDQPNQVAWYKDNSGNSTHQVGQKLPNKFGLYDLQGNVWEWCEDIFIEDYKNLPKDGMPNLKLNQNGKIFRSIRGGSYFSSSNGIISNRYWETEDFHNGDIGFRLAARRLSEFEKSIQ